MTQTKSQLPDSLPILIYVGGIVVTMLLLAVLTSWSSRIPTVEARHYDPSIDRYSVLVDGHWHETTAEEFRVIDVGDVWGRD